MSRELLEAKAICFEHNRLTSRAMPMTPERARYGRTYVCYDNQHCTFQLADDCKQFCTLGEYNDWRRTKIEDHLQS